MLIHLNLPSKINDKITGQRFHSILVSILKSQLIMCSVYLSILVLLCMYLQVLKNSLKNKKYYLIGQEIVFYQSVLSRSVVFNHQISRCGNVGIILWIFVIITVSGGNIEYVMAYA